MIKPMYLAIAAFLCCVIQPVHSSSSEPRSGYLFVPSGSSFTFTYGPNSTVRALISETTRRNSSVLPEFQCFHAGRSLEKDELLWDILSSCGDCRPTILALFDKTPSVQTRWISMTRDGALDRTVSDLLDPRLNPEVKRLRDIRIQRQEGSRRGFRRLRVPPSSFVSPSFPSVITPSLGSPNDTPLPLPFGGG
jgi:hypothetical protein